MQIKKAEVIPIELGVQPPGRMAGLSAEIREITAVFIRLETQQGQSAWGCTVAHPDLTGQKPEEVIRACQEGAALAVDLHPTNLEYSLTELAAAVAPSPTAMCAFDLAFHDLLSLAAGMPLYRILGGYRSRIQTSVTLPIADLDESVETAQRRAQQGFRMLKVKGGIDPAEDVRRVQAIHQALPDLALRLDADGGYSTRDALDVARALDQVLEVLEQPTPASDLKGLKQVTDMSPVTVVADQSLRGLDSALELAAGHIADGLSIKLATCGGLRCARQIDAIARAAHLATMAGCVIEPALLTAAGLALALSSPNVRYADLDGYLTLANDPSRASFRLEDGWLVASEIPGLGYSVELG